MAQYIDNPKEHIPYLTLIKPFAEIKKGDNVYILNIKTLNIIEKAVDDVKFEDWKSYDSGYIFSLNPLLNSESKTVEYEFKRVVIFVDMKSYGTLYHTETNIIDDNYVVCTTLREAKQIRKILLTKCEIQMNQFKSIFNGCGWNYAEPDVLLN